MRRLLVLLGLSGVLLSCTSLPETPLEHADLGTYVVSSFELPQGQRGAMPWAQRLIGKAFVFGPDRILYPQEFGHPDCQHEGYRLTSRPVAFLVPFDLGEGSSLGVLEAGIEDRDLLEVWNYCLSGVYLSVDRGKMYLPGRGALFILDRQ
jgi:hypothetical protein